MNSDVSREDGTEPATCPGCGAIVEESPSPVRLTTVGSITGGGGGGELYCPVCEDELQHLHALFMGGGKFRFCGCGCPGDAYDLVRNILQLCPLYDNWETGTSNSAKVQEILGGIDGTFYLVLYAIDSLDLIEHGGSIGGSWLAEKGTHYLPLMAKHPFDAVSEAGLPHDGDDCPPDCRHWVASYPDYQRDAIIKAKKQQPPDPHEPIPSSDPRCHCSRTRRDGWGIKMITGKTAHRDAKDREARLWIHLDCPHHGGIARQLNRA